MERRGFLGSLLGLLIVKRLPVGDTPIVEVPVAPTFIPSLTMGTTGTAVGSGSMWIDISKVNTPWTYTVHRGTDG